MNARKRKKRIPFITRKWLNEKIQTEIVDLSKPYLYIFRLPYRLEQRNLLTIWCILREIKKMGKCNPDIQFMFIPANIKSLSHDDLDTAIDLLLKEKERRNNLLEQSKIVPEQLISSETIS